MQAGRARPHRRARRHHVVDDQHAQAGDSADAATARERIVDVPLSIRKIQRALRRSSANAQQGVVDAWHASHASDAARDLGGLVVTAFAQTARVQRHRNDRLEREDDARREPTAQTHPDRARCAELHRENRGSQHAVMGSQGRQRRSTVAGAKHDRLRRCKHGGAPIAHIAAGCVARHTTHGQEEVEDHRHLVPANARFVKFEGTADFARRACNNREMRDEALMRKALALAARGAGNTSPNPMVGAVVASEDGEIIATGFHEAAGAPHAEALALESAGPAARGATLYVTLEPCDHQGQTPPCTQAIVRSGVARVVVAATDDDERVRGAGIERLRAAGLIVDVGVCEADARRLNRMYVHQRRTGLPYVTLKMAQSLDGAIGPRAGERTQLTGEKAAAHVRALRYEHDAVMVGIETAMVDDPQLTVRPYKRRAVPFARIVVDTTARVRMTSNLVSDQARALTIVATTDRAPLDRVEALKDAGVDVLVANADQSGKVDLRDLLTRLSKRGMLGVLCEGGPTLGGALMEAGLVSEIHLIVAPVVLGSASVAPVLSGLSAPVRTRIQAVRSLGDDVLVVANPT